MLIDDNEEADREEIEEKLALEHISGFCETFEKIIKISVSILHSKLLIYKIKYIQQ